MLTFLIGMLCDWLSSFFERSLDHSNLTAPIETETILHVLLSLVAKI